jgi:hypothetical protein
MHAAILVAGISFAVSVVPPSSIDGLMISLFFTGAAVVVTVYALMQCTYDIVIFLFVIFLLSTRSFVLWRDYNTTTAERIG